MRRIATLERTEKPLWAVLEEEGVNDTMRAEKVSSHDLWRTFQATTELLLEYHHY